MKGRLSLVLGVVALLMLCGCSSYEVISSREPAPLPDTNVPSLNVEIHFSPDNIEPADDIHFSIPENSWVRLQVLNATGHRVKLLMDEWFTGGYGTVSWDHKNDDGVSIKSGIYIYQLDAGDYSASQVRFLCFTVEDCEKMSHEN